MVLNAELICVGNELLIGKVTNTNATWLAQRLTELGAVVRRMQVVGDDLDEISSAVRSAVGRRPFMIITTGGLGPTYDDMTTAGVAKALNVGVRIDPEALRMIETKYRSLSLELTPARTKMARLPEGGSALPNPVGTAPGCVVEHSGVRIVSLPGVPSEMQAMFSESVVPVLSGASEAFAFKQASVLLGGIHESALAPILDEVRERNPLAYFKSHPKMSEGRPLIEVHISTRGRDAEAADRVVREGTEDLVKTVKSHGAQLLSEAQLTGRGEDC